MASSSEDVNLLLEHIERLERENASLKVQCEISQLRTELDGLQIPPGRQEAQLKGDTESRLPEDPVLDARIVNAPENVTLRKHQRSNTKTHFVKAATYDGNSSWLDYKAHFETCAEINGWNYVDKGLYLAVSLRGQAQGVFGNLSTNSKDYSSLVKALEERFAPPNQTELYRVQLRERRQRATETLSELGQDIRRLTNLAYPSAPADLKETLAKEQFIDSLISIDMRLRVKQARPISLNDAVRHAVELEAFNRAEKAKMEGQGIIGSTDIVPKSDISKQQDNEAIVRLQETVDKLQKQLQSLQTSTPRENKRFERRSFGDRRYDRACFNCGSKSHLQAECPKPKPTYSGRRGSPEW